MITSFHRHSVLDLLDFLRIRSWFNQAFGTRMVAKHQAPKLEPDSGWTSAVQREGSDRLDPQDLRPATGSRSLEDRASRGWSASDRLRPLRRARLRTVFSISFTSVRYDRYRLRVVYRFRGDAMHRRARLGLAQQRGDAALSGSEDDDSGAASFQFRSKGQFLGGDGTNPRRPEISALPVRMLSSRVALEQAHCINSNSKTCHGDELGHGGIRSRRCRRGQAFHRW